MSVGLGYTHALRAPMPAGRAPPCLFLPGILLTAFALDASPSAGERAEVQAIVARLGAERPTSAVWIGPGGAITPAAAVTPAWLRQQLARRAWCCIPA